MPGKLREVTVYYHNIGPKKAREVQVHSVNMAAHLTDEQIADYYKAGKWFNLGVAGFDLMGQVDKIEIVS